MATRIDDPEEWESIEPHDLRSTDPVAVARIMTLLETAKGHLGENRESLRKRKALALLGKLVMPTIQNRCRFKLRGSYPDDVDAVANRIFASHAAGTPFLADGPYKTWAETWIPEKRPLIVFVAVCATRRCNDWLRSQETKRSFRAVTSLDGVQGYPASIPATVTDAGTPEASVLEDELFKSMHLILAKMPPGAATDAIRARICEDLTAAEYAQRESIPESTASMRMKRGAEKLVNQLQKSGAVGEGFGLNRNSVSYLKSRRVVTEGSRPSNDISHEGER